MRIEIVGIGRMGSAIAYSLMLMRSGMTIYLNEPYVPNKQKAKAEYYDLLPVAIMTGNELVWSERFKCCNHVITAGLPRTAPSQKKEALLKPNLPIVERLINSFPVGYKIFLVTNPPELIAKNLPVFVSPVIPLRSCTDNARNKAGDPNINSYVLKHKGFTQFTPGYACAKEILNHL